MTTTGPLRGGTPLSIARGIMKKNYFGSLEFFDYFGRFESRIIPGAEIPVD